MHHSPYEISYPPAGETSGRTPFDAPDMPQYERAADTHDTHMLQHAEYVSLPADAPAIETVRNKDGSESDVLAILNHDSGNNTLQDYNPAAKLLVVRDKDGAISFRGADTRYGSSVSHQIGQEQTPKQKYRRRPIGIDTGSGAPKVDIVYTAPAKKGDAPTIHIGRRHTGASVGHDKFLKVATAAGIAREHPGEHLTNATEANRRRHSRIFRKWAAGAALVGAVASGLNETGGAYDSIQDGRTNAGAAVTEYVEADTAEERAAVGRVAEAMEALDKHDYARIQAEAHAFQERNTHDLMPEADAASYKYAVENAPDAETAMALLDAFMQNYGKHAAFDTQESIDFLPYDARSTSAETAQQYALGIIDFYHKQPKSLIAAGEYDTVLFSQPKPHEAGEPEAGGHYDGDNGAIRFSMKDHGSDTRKSAAHTAAHEHAHSLEGYARADGATIAVPHNSENRLNEFNWFESAVYHAPEIVDKPQEASEYAAANGDREEFADEVAGLLVPGEANQLANPDNHRLFHSPANQRFLERAAWLEKSYAGITYYIANYAGTADRSEGRFNAGK